jgi:hypothetical protein
MCGSAPSNLLGCDRTADLGFTYGGWARDAHFSTKSLSMLSLYIVC